MPKLKVKPEELDFGTETTQLTFAITNENDKTEMEWQITMPENSEWLSVSKKSGKLKKGEESITVKIDRSKMTEAKTYNANLVIKSTNGGGSAIIVVMANKVMPKLTVTPKELNFGSDKKEMKFLIQNTNSKVPMDWTISKPDNDTWLSLSETEGSALTETDKLITVSIDRSTMKEGTTYSSLLTVKSTNGGGTATVSVTAQKQGAKLTAQPESLDFGKTETELTILLSNSIGKGKLTYQSQATNSWITIENGSGEITDNQTAQITVKVSRKDISVGNHKGTIVITSNANKLTIDVNMDVEQHQIPTVENLSQEEGSVTHNSVTVSAKLTDAGSSNITEHGFCWSTSPNPTISDSKQTLGTINAGQTFNSTITGLSANTKYYVKAFATSDAGTAYSNSISFTTLKELQLAEYSKEVELTSSATVAVTSSNGACKVQIDNPTIVKTDITGQIINIKAIKGGTATITVTDTKSGQTKKIVITVTSNISYITVEGGTFMMGRPGSKSGDVDYPPHQVTLSTFKISKYEITNAQFVKFLNVKGNTYSGSIPFLAMGSSDIEKSGKIYKVKSGLDNYPIRVVTWYGAKAYCEWVGGRLPTEAEWEYAARGGKKSKDYKFSGSNAPYEVAWYRKNSPEAGCNKIEEGIGTHPVGNKNANELGIYDMNGNVWEWCNDWFGNYSSSSSTNPIGPSSGDKRVLRGNSYHGNPVHIWHREYRKDPAQTKRNIGFRVVLN